MITINFLDVTVTNVAKKLLKVSLSKLMQTSVSAPFSNSNWKLNTTRFKAPNR